jgi:FkbM family methyltransferase
MKVSVKTFLTKKIRNTLGGKGIHVFRNSVPRGFNVYADLRKIGLIDQVRTFIDIGANEGEYAEEALSSLFKLEQAILIEPERINFERLAGKFDNRVQIVQCAISNFNGLGVLNISNSDKMHSLTSSRIECSLASSKSQSVKVCTLPEVVASLAAPPPFFIKSDTEGHDIQVLEGMQGMFDDVLAMVVEGTFARVQNITFFQDAHDLMIERGFLFWGIYDQSPWGRKGECNVVNGLFVNAKFLTGK